MANNIGLVAKKLAFDLAVSVVNSGLCAFVTRKISYMIDRQEQAKLVASEHKPVQKEKRIGFFSEKDENS